MKKNNIIHLCFAMVLLLTNYSYAFSETDAFRSLRVYQFVSSENASGTNSQSNESQSGTPNPTSGTSSVQPQKNDSAARSNSVASDSTTESKATTVTTTICNHAEYFDKTLGFILFGVLLSITILFFLWSFSMFCKKERRLKSLEAGNIGSSAKRGDNNYSSTLSRENSTQIKNLEKVIDSLKIELAELKNANKTATVEVTNSVQSTTTIKKTQNTNEPIVYTYLKVVDGGHLSVCSADAAHYRSWKKNGVLLFEFCCQKVGKAISNRTSIIEPMCEVQRNSNNPDSASSVSTISPGKLNGEYELLEKCKIKYN